MLSACSEWRAFTDEEEARLQDAKAKLKEDKEAAIKAGKAEDKEIVEGEGGAKRAAEDEDEAEPLHIVPVGLDNLFTVHLVRNVLYPAFWTGQPVRVIECHWFYLPPSNNTAAVLPSHHMKPYPVDPALSASLDRAFSRIRPWQANYADELNAALKGGAEAQQKLAVPLAVENEAELAGKNRDLGIEVIFEGANRGRLYSRGVLGGMGKSFWSSGKSLGGGQVVLRGSSFSLSSPSYTSVPH
jgi:phospholipase DDHD1